MQRRRLTGLRTGLYRLQKRVERLERRQEKGRQRPGDARLYQQAIAAIAEIEDSLNNTEEVT